MRDMVHALTAHDHEVRDFCTNDQQFNVLACDPRFATMNFMIFCTCLGHQTSDCADERFPIHNP